MFVGAYKKPQIFCLLWSNHCIWANAFDFANANDFDNANDFLDQILSPSGVQNALNSKVFLCLRTPVSTPVSSRDYFDFSME